MSPQESLEVAGVDGCRAGWFAAIASAVEQTCQADVPCILKLKEFLVARTFADVLSKTPECELVCVDIPIGLSDSTEPRECDIAARKVLRERASSVFPPPIRQCLWANDPETASRICFEYSGKKLNRQSFFIMSKIREVDQMMTPELQQRVREIHPEISFWALNGKKPTGHNKKGLVGRNERIKLLAPIFPGVPESIAKARRPQKVAPDDILDALVAAWTAGQAVVGKSKTLPENPKIDSRRLKMEILYPST